jgi:hypothetical protein
MKYNRYTLILTFAVLMVLPSCDKGAYEESKAPKSIDLNNEDNMINGRKWTLAKLSDSLDAGFDLDKAKQLFGDDPSISNDGDFTTVTYGIDTPNLYEDGVRATIFELYFEKGILIDARIGFSAYGDLIPKNAPTGTDKLSPPSENNSPEIKPE